MIEVVKLFKTYGSLGVLTIWLLFTNNRVDKLEMKLEACNQSKFDILNNKVSKHKENKLPLVAIITQPITLKNIEDEKEC
jgi:hypothetical protein